MILRKDKTLESLKDTVVASVGSSNWNRLYKCSSRLLLICLAPTRAIVSASSSIMTVWAQEMLAVKILLSGGERFFLHPVDRFQDT